MAIKLGNITFNNVDTIGNGSPYNNVVKDGRDVDSFNNLNNKAESGQITKVKLAQSIGVVDAVSINWNGAQVAEKTLNTTGEVLSSYKIAI